MNAIVESALEAWGLEGATFELVAERENRVFRIHKDAATYAMRLHRPGYCTGSELASELAWMDALDKGGLKLPAPIGARDGTHLLNIKGTYVDLLTWLNGQTLSECLDDMDPATRQSVFRDLGAGLAKLHILSDDWTPPASFERPNWDRDGLLGETPFWDRFWENPGLTGSQKRLLSDFRMQARDRLEALGDARDFGLIHADLVPSNVLFDAGKLHFIDFNDSGWGYRLFDIATVLLKHRGAADYPALRQAVLDGYRAERALDPDELDFFLCLRALTYVGWNITRMSEKDGELRNARFIKTAIELCDACDGPT